MTLSFLRTLRELFTFGVFSVHMHLLEESGLRSVRPSYSIEL